jgi:hypothetical protein
MLGITVQQATGLPDMDYGGGADPYCIVKVGPHEHRSHHLDKAPPSWVRARSSRPSPASAPILRGGPLRREGALRSTAQGDPAQGPLTWPPCWGQAPQCPWAS